ncbi:hypothetical protein ACS0PU_005300 [Formica fusca]
MDASATIRLQAADARAPPVSISKRNSQLIH